MKARKGILSIIMVLLACSGLAESRTGYVNGSNPNTNAYFYTILDSSYTLSACPTDGWIFTDAFSYPSSNGWYKSGSYSASCESIPAVTTVFVDAASIFSVTINGKMYKPGGTGSLVDWSVTGEGSGSAPTYTVDPAEATFPKGSSQTYIYKVNGSAAPSGMWRVIPDILTNYSGSSAYHHFSTSADAGTYIVSAARNSAGAKAAGAVANVVEVASIFTTAYGETITSTTDSPGNEESICTEAYGSGALTFSATPNPSGQWPTHGSPAVSYPEWYIGSTKVQDGGTYTFSPEDRDAGIYKITAKCGSSSKAINVYVVSMVYTLYVREPDPGSGKPYLWGTWIKPDPGHAFSRIHLTPNEAKNIAPFSYYSACLVVDDMPMGFGTSDRVTAVTTGSGAGELFLQDSSSYGKYKVHRISSVSQAITALREADAWRTVVPPYIIGTSSSAYEVLLGVYTWNWTQPTDQNCLTFARSIATRSGCSLPSGTASSVDAAFGHVISFTGDCPGGIGPSL